MRDYDPAPDVLADRVVLVTGAGDGIGRAVARRLASHGATVVLLGRTVRKLEKVYDQIEEAGGPRPAIFPMNLEGAAPKDYDDLAESLKTEFGRLDGLVHNAAAFKGLTPILHYDVEHWFRVLQVNLNAPFLLTRAVLELMTRSEDGSIVFTTDAVCEEGRAYWGAYSAAKAGSMCLMRTLANELEENTKVRANGIDPGDVRTYLRLSAYPAGNPDEWADPESITGAYVYLVGPDSAGTRGTILRAQD